MIKYLNEFELKMIKNNYEVECYPSEIIEGRRISKDIIELTLKYDIQEHEVYLINGELMDEIEARINGFINWN